MIKNYFKIAVRNLLKYKGYSSINIFGLAIGISCCILILLFVQDEISFDRHNENADRIYRIGINGVVGTNEFRGAVSPTAMSRALINEFPEVESATRVRNFGFPVLRYGDKVFSEEKFFWVDSTFFKIFTVKFLKGDPATALTQPMSVVITESMAKKYFGNEDPMGKALNSDNRRDYFVTGVIEDTPVNSHWHYDFLAALSSYEFTAQNTWLDNNYYTYVLLKPGFSKEDLQNKLPELIKKYIGPQLQQVLGISYEQFLKNGGVYEYFVQPLTDIHLHSNLEFELEPNGDITYVYIFSFIAFAILIIACINFMNLTTARSANRAKEIGIRKTLGSNRTQLIRQFLTETVMMTVIAIIIALIMIELLLPPFNNLIGKHMEINYISNPYFIPFLAALTLIIGVTAGSYPAFYLSAFDPVKVLKKGPGSKGKSPWLRNGLVVSQFSISILLFIGTFIVYSQLEYIKNKKLGFNKEQIVVIQKTDDLGARIYPFKDELRQLPGVLNVSNTSTLPGQNFGNTGFRIPGQQETHLIWTLFTDYAFAETYQVSMAKGRYFERDRKSDSLAIVVNETAARMMGIHDDPIGKQVYPFGGDPETAPKFNIIGVVKDFHFESLHQAIRPLLIRQYPQQAWGRYVSVRISGADIPKMLETLKDKWHDAAGEQAFEYVFFDEDFAKVYENEERTGIIVAVFSFLAIIIACLGLLGLASFTTEQRTKEIGIRKTLGASVSGIIFMLSKDFTKWVVAANLIAWPAAYFIMQKWLEEFAYRIDISIWTFVFAAVSALIIALITVVYQSIKAASADPVKALKYE